MLTARVGGGWLRQFRPAFMRPIVAAFAIMCAAIRPSGVCAQDLAPRAYLITPLHSNAVTVSDIYNDGELLFDGTVPITEATGRLNVFSVTLYHSLGFLGRSANVAVGLPYGVGTFRGNVLGSETSTSRSGCFDAAIRFAVNVKGAPAMPVGEWMKWRQKTLLGVSLKILAPTGQYDATKLINLGANRWTFKPELGLSQRWGHIVIDGYGAVWLFTKNPEFFSHNAYVSGTQEQTQEPIGVFEVHLSYDVMPRLWISLDGNFWYGGKTSLNGVESPATLQRSSRVGVTAALPVSRHQSVKLGYADGAYIRFGGDYRVFSIAWQYAWIGRPN
jgi:hypothetical protein